MLILRVSDLHVSIGEVHLHRTLSQFGYGHFTMLHRVSNTQGPAELLGGYLYRSVHWAVTAIDRHESLFLLHP